MGLHRVRCNEKSWAALRGNRRESDGVRTEPAALREALGDDMQTDLQDSQQDH